LVATLGPHVPKLSPDSRSLLLKAVNDFGVTAGDVLPFGQVGGEIEKRRLIEGVSSTRMADPL
jgi:hypothetical protein